MSARRVRLSEYEPRRIGLIKPSALGDIVHSLPVLTALRQRYPAAHITWVVNRSYEALLHGHPDLDATLPFDRGAVGAGAWRAVRSGSTFLVQLRQARLDLVIDLQGLLRSGLMALLSGAPRRVGLATAREGAALCYTDVIAAPGLADRHAVDRYLQVSKALGGPADPPRFHLPIETEALRWADTTLGEYPRPWLVLCVGARWETKRWPAEHFAALAGRVQREFGGTAVFVGRDDEAEPARRAAALLTGTACDLTGATDLPQLAAVLSRADAVLANDTGPMHLADALGRPVVAPYTCTRVGRHGPYHSRGGAVATAVPCAGSYLRRCDRLDCMRDLTPDRLWPHLREVLRTWQRTYQYA